ncbi:MAG: hypothetical protein EWV66_08085 [Microcystis sp. M_OC_Ca_00000000_C217Col]|nr:MAG: hypothetical protein EWV66_08085 [Microcystis sp. M_OC_Ca_00000000_C217Col]
MLRKTSQFSGKAKPNTQHLNLSESFCWVSLGVLLGFLGCIVGFRASTQPTVETQHPTPPCPPDVGGVGGVTPCPHQQTFCRKP